VFGSATGVPMALMQHLRHNHVLHQRVLLLSTLTAVMPHVPEEERAEITALEYGLTRVVLQFGFMERPDVPAALRQLAQHPAMEGIDPDDVTYYLRRETVVPTRQEGTMRPWRKALFATMLLNAHRSATYYGLPLAKVIEVGIEVEI